MIRTVINLPDDDKAWLDHVAQTKGVSMTEVVRLAVQHFRRSQAESQYHNLLQQTAGLWAAGDGLEFQSQLRSEWK